MPKTREQCQEIKDERRESIIRTCTKLFSYHEYQSVSVDTITKAANCSHGLFYHYFNSKEHVFDATLQYAISNINSLVYKNDDESLPPKVRLTHVIDSIVYILSGKNDDLVGQLYLLLNLHLKTSWLIHVKPSFVPKEKPIFHLVLDLVEQGQKDGSFEGNEPKEYTIALVSMIKGLTYNRLHLGHDKFICPSTKILMNILKKD